MPDPTNETPYQLSLGPNIQPTDAAWLEVSRAPIDRYSELTGTELPDDVKSRSFSLHKTGLGERESALLVDVNEHDLEPHAPTLDRIRQSLIAAGLKEKVADHLVRVFALGVLAGIKTAEFTQEYAAEGVRDLEKNL